MVRLVIDFLSKECRTEMHSMCSKIWTGLGLETVCNCKCHKKSPSTERISGSDSVDDSHCPLEGAKNDY